jgi:hypothetical protein
VYRPLDNDALITLVEKKALRWYRAHGPAGISDPGSPPRPMRVHLIKRGLLCIDPMRRIGDPITYVITDEGRKVIEQCQ